MDADNTSGDAASQGAAKEDAAKSNEGVVDDDDAMVAAQLEDDKNSAMNSSDQHDDDSDYDDDDDNGGDDDEDEDENGLSQYEKLRLERIKRNQQYLSQLGLDDSKPKATPSKKRKRTDNPQQSSTPQARDRSSLSRRTKRDIKYTQEKGLSKEENERLQQEKEERKRRREANRELKRQKLLQPRPKKEKPLAARFLRMDHLVYSEFRRMKTFRRQHLQTIDRELRAAKREVRHWQKELAQHERTEKRRSETERTTRLRDEEMRQLGGRTKLDLLKEIDSRMVELQNLIAQHEGNLLVRKTRAEAEEKQELSRRKVQIMDAIDRFPKMIKEATGSLNSLLVERCPKNPTQPHSSRRASTSTTAVDDTEADDAEDESEETVPDTVASSKTRATRRALKTGIEDAGDSALNDDANESWKSLAAELQGHNLVSASDVARAKQAKKATAQLDHGAKANIPSKRVLSGRNVGGWVSSEFSEQVDRSWLEKVNGDHCAHMASFVPQIGDVVLYYPSAHKAIYDRYPDILARETGNHLRTPLWIKARREAARIRKGKKAATSGASKQTDGAKEELKQPENQQQPHQQPHQQELSQPQPTPSSDPADAGKEESRWWNEEWLQGAESGMWDFPIICRVDRAHAEFPPDPKVKKIKKKVDDASDSATSPSNAKRSKPDKPAARLAVALRPLTPLLPVLSETYDKEHALSVPPNFALVIEPHHHVKPCLVPLTWAYCRTHSLRSEDEVLMPSTGTKPVRGRIESFRDLSPHYCKSSLEDKQSLLESFVRACEVDSKVSWDAVDALLSREQTDKRTRLRLPTQEAHAIIQFMSKLLQQQKEAEEEESDGGGDSGGDNDKGEGVEHKGKSQQADESGVPTEKKETSPAATSVRFIDLLQSTLPLWNGVNVSRKDKHQNAFQCSPWSLAMTSRQPVSRGEGSTYTSAKIWMPSRMGADIRMEIEVSIEAFIKRNKDASIFVRLVTEDLAPGYLNAVPVPISLDRILKRLSTKRKNKNNTCYYRSVEAIVADIQAILDNCVLYNNPDSEVVSIALNIVARLKVMVADVVENYVRGRQAWAKQQQQWQRLLATTTAPTAADASSNNPGGGSETAGSLQSLVGLPSVNKRHARMREGTNTPFHGELVQYRAFAEWSNRASDRTTKTYDEGPNEDVDTPSDETWFWLPQVGDNVLYSRHNHAKFIKHHFDAFSDAQCEIPSLPPQSQENRNDDTGDAGANSTAQWIKARVLWVQLCFPSPEAKREKYSFDMVLPVFHVGLLFQIASESASSASSLPSTQSSSPSSLVGSVTWRPCGTHNASDPDAVCSKCTLCIKTSFLKPSWTDAAEHQQQKQQQQQHDGHRVGNAAAIPRLPDESVTSLGECMDLIKQRVLNDIPVDQIDTQACIETMQGISRSPSKQASTLQDVPSFEFLLTGQEKKGCTSVGADSGKSSRRSKYRKKPAVPSVDPRLLETHFVPPWIDGSNAAHQGSEGKASHEPGTFLPNPTMCIEAILLRLRNGHYRHIQSVQNDVMEAYVTTVHYIALKQQHQKHPNLSMRRIAKFLSSKKGNINVWIAHATTVAKRAIMAKKGSKSKSNKGPPTASVACADAQHTQVQSAENKSHGAAAYATVTASLGTPKLSAEEQVLAQQIMVIRRVYATVLACTMNQERVIYIFGLKELGAIQRKVADIVKLTPTQNDHLEKIKWVVAVAGRDPKRNRNRSSGSIKLQITCGGEQVLGDDIVITVPVNPTHGFQTQANPAAYMDAPPSCVPFISNHAPWNTNPSVVVIPAMSPGTMPCPAMTAPVATRQVTVPQSHIVIGSMDMMKNDRLTQSLYCRDVKLLPCLRCEARWRPLYECRVQKGHSNFNLDYVDCFGSGGGIDGLIGPLRPATAAIEAQQAASTPEETIAPPSTQGSEVVSALPSGAGVGAPQPSSADAPSAGIVPKAKDAAPKADPAVQLEIAQDALKLAQELFEVMGKALSDPLRLSWRFIKETFPVDDSDGHYVYCIICGLSGDVLCCDGCANVVHTHCIGLPKVPEEDWYCQICRPYDGPPSSEERTSGENAAASAAAPSAGVGGDDADARARARAYGGEIGTNKGTDMDVEAGTPDAGARAGVPPEMQEAEAKDGADGAPPPAAASSQASESTHLTPRVKIPSFQEIGHEGIKLYPVEDEANGWMADLDKLSRMITDLQMARGLEKRFLIMKKQEAQAAKAQAEEAKLRKKASAKRDDNDDGDSDSDAGEGDDVPHEHDNSETNEEEKLYSETENENTVGPLFKVGHTFRKEYMKLGTKAVRVLAQPTPDSMYYSVQLEDGDEEDMLEFEIKRLTKRLDKEKKATSQPNAQKQRSTANPSTHTPSRSPLQRSGPKRRGRPPKSETAAQMPEKKRPRHDRDAPQRKNGPSSAVIDFEIVGEEPLCETKQPTKKGKEAKEAPLMTPPRSGRQRKRPSFYTIM